jgi:hypothetical protein
VTVWHSLYGFNVEIDVPNAWQSKACLLDAAHRRRRGTSQDRSDNDAWRKQPATAMKEKREIARFPNISLQHKGRSPMLPRRTTPA